MSESADIGFAGAGQMGEALIRGLLQADLMSPGAILASDIVPGRLDYMRETYGIAAASSNAELPRRCRTLILAVKPQDVGAVLSDWSAVVGGEHLVISIAAGVPLSLLQGKMGPGVRLVRAMPNMPCLIQMGCTALAPGGSATEADVERARAIFKAVGEAVVVEEKWMDAVTGLSGSGPGYVFLFVEALVEAGVRTGLSRPVCRTLAVQTLRGAAEMLLSTGEHPALLRERVSSPGGTTLAGLAVLERGGFRSLVMEAVEAASRRSRELGESMGR